MNKYLFNKYLYLIELPVYTDPKNIKDKKNPIPNLKLGAVKIQ
jgi:hypothetical protein